MAVRKICKLKGCRASPRCEHPWWFDVMYQGKRWRMRVDEFALARGATEPITSKQTAERVWEPKNSSAAQALLAACSAMNSAEHKFVGPAMHDRIIGPGDLLSSGRDAPPPEPGCGLGSAPDRHPRREREGCGEPPPPVRPTWPAHSDPETASSLGTLRLRVRLPGRAVPGQLQDGLGITAASPTATTRHVRSPGRGSIVRSSG
jgi:hypothetical protein